MLGAMLERLIYGPRLDVTDEQPEGARRLTPEERAGEVAVDVDLDVMEIATDVAARGFEWRAEEARHLMDRAATVLTAASVVLGIGAGLLGQGGTTASVRTLLVVALLSYVLLAVLMVLALALRPRPLPRDTGYAVNFVWSDAASLRRRHHEALLNRAVALDRSTTARARLVVAGGALLTVEVIALTLAIVLGMFAAA